MRWTRTILFLLFTSPVVAQVSDEERYRLVNPAEVRTAGDLIEQDHVAAFRRLRGMMSQFYSNSVDKNVPEPGDEIIPDDYETIYNWDIAARRSFIKETISLEQNPGLLREAENIFYLHYYMAQVYEKEKRYFAASYHYRAALRYRPLGLTPEAWSDPARADLITDDAEKEAAKRYAARKEEFESVQREYDQKKGEFAVEVDQAAQLSDNETAARLRDRYQAELQTMQLGVQEKERALLESQAEFENYRKRYNVNSSRFLSSYAGLVLRLDEEIRERKKIYNSEQNYRNDRNFTSKQNWDHAENHQAAFNLLEAASRLHPENPAAPLLKAELYRSSGDLDRAIFSYEQALLYHDAATPGDALKPEELENVYRRLAGLYRNTKRYVDSALYYEKWLALAGEEATFEMRYELARLHTLRTGNYERAVELLDGLLEDPSFTKNLGGEPLAVAQNVRNFFYLHYHMMICGEKMGDEKVLNRALEGAVASHQIIKKLLDEQEALLEKSRLTLLQLREQRNRDRINGVSIGQEKLQELYLARDNHERLKGLVEDLHSIYRSLDFKKIYFTIARLYEKNHRIAEAVEIYRVAESHGFAPDEARREVRRLQKKYE